MQQQQQVSVPTGQGGQMQPVHVQQPYINNINTPFPSERPGFEKKAFYVLGIIQMVFAGLCFLLAIITIAVESGFYFVGHGLCCGVVVNLSNCICSILKKCISVSDCWWIDFWSYSNANLCLVSYPVLIYYLVLKYTM
jgi:hypothetical protein